MTYLETAPLAWILALGLWLTGAEGTGAGRIASSLEIEPGRTFELGGGQPGGFVVTGRNTGRVAVEVLGKLADAEPAPRGTIAPGAALDARFGPGEMALLRNTSDRTAARLKLTITGDTQALGMTYADNP